MTKPHWQDWANLALGLWVIVSPWTIAHSMASPPNPSGVAESAMWGLHVLGILVTVVALMSITAYASWKEWVNLVLGACLLVSPWVLGFTASAGLTWSVLITGGLIALLAGWLAIAEPASKTAAK